MQKRITILQLALFLALLFCVSLPVQAEKKCDKKNRPSASYWEDDEGYYRDRYGDRHRAPLIIVPQNYFGTVEVYRTKNGYMVRTRKEESNTYEEIEKYLKKNPVVQDAK